MSSRVVVASLILTALFGGGVLFLVLSPDDGEAGGPAGTSASGPSGRDGGSERSGSASRDGRDAGSFGTSGGGDETSADHLTSNRGTDGRIRPRDGGSTRNGSGTRTSGGPTGTGTGTATDRGTGSAGTGTDDRIGSDGTRRPTGSSGSRTNRTNGSRSGDGTAIDGALTTEEGNGTEEEVGPQIVITGSIVVREEDGTEHAEEAGTLDIRITGTGIDSARTMTVDAGTWSVSVPEGAQMTFTRALLRERAASVSPSTPIIAQEGTTVQLTAQWTNETLLHVRSRATGEVLCDLRLLRVPDWMRNSRPHPGVPTPNDQLWTAECSPFPLAAEGAHAGQSVPYHVHSPGYAWGRILLDTTTGGDREILLDPGGVIDVTFDGGWDHPDAVVRLRNIGSIQPYAEAPVTGEVMQIDGVLPGAYEISVETGNWAQNPLVLGVTEVTVAAGEATALLLPVDELLDEDRVPFAGTVFIPAGWLLDEFQLRLRPIDPGRNVVEETQHIPSLEMAATEIQGGVLYSWQADDVEPGNFGMLVLPIGYGVNVAVPETGNVQADISLPPPVLVEVRTVIEGTVEPATPNMIRWTPVREQGVPGAGALSVLPDPPGGNVFFFEAPIGGVILSSSDPQYRPASRQIQLTPEGPNVFDFELQPAHGVSLNLYDLDTPVPWDIGWHAHMTPMEGTTGQVVTRGRVGIGYRILVSSPGGYTLTLPEIDGFLPVDPMPVEVLDGQIIDLDIMLQRIP